MTKWIVAVLCLFLLVLQFRFWQGTGSMRDVMRMQEIVNSQTQEVARLTERNLRLAEEIKILKAYPSVLEERARSELGMIKPGETFCLVIE